LFVIYTGFNSLCSVISNDIPAEKKTWWWNKKVHDAIKAKKKAKTKYDASGIEEDKCKFKAAK